MQKILMVAPGSAGFGSVAEQLKNCSSRWTVWAGESSFLEGKSTICVSVERDGVLEDYCQLTPTQLDFSDEDYPLELAKADAELYSKLIPDYQLFSVEYFRSKRKNVMVEILTVIDSACSGIVIDNGYGVIAFFRDIQRLIPYPEWEFCKSHSSNLT